MIIFKYFLNTGISFKLDHLFNVIVFFQIIRLFIIAPFIEMHSMTPRTIIISCACQQLIITQTVPVSWLLPRFLDKTIRNMKGNFAIITNFRRKKNDLSLIYHQYIHCRSRKQICQCFIILINIGNCYQSILYCFKTTDLTLLFVLYSSLRNMLLM